jgi:hypothetical protein
MLKKIKLMLLVTSLVIAFAAFAKGELNNLTTGVSAASLADTQTTSWMSMNNGDNTFSSQLTLYLDVTAGTSTRVQVQCKGSTSASGGSWASVCYPGASSGDPDACQIDVREYTLSAGTAIKSEWRVNSPYVLCQFDDPDDGTGTITVTAQRGNL